MWLAQQVEGMWREFCPFMRTFPNFQTASTIPLRERFQRLKPRRDLVFSAKEARILATVRSEPH
jgi:hypothetical protein